MKVNEDSVEIALQDKVKLFSDEFYVDELILKKPENIEKLMDEIDEVIPGVYAAIYKFINAKGVFTEFVQQINCVREGKIGVSVFGVEEHCVIDEFFSWFVWMFSG